MWFDVDREGLKKILARRGKEFVVLELIQNAWDQDVTEVSVTLEHIEGRRGRARLVVEDDDPEGFSDISHAWTLFADSEKKVDPELRGRFNIGEKLVLAVCDEATITTTTGRVIFDSDGRKSGRKKTEAGSIFEGVVQMTIPEIEQAVEAVHSLLPPPDVKTTFNGDTLTRKEMLDSFEVTLPTEVADEEGLLKPTNRKTVVEVYETSESEDAQLYEMGIPVVATGDRWHVNVLQKVPLNMDRDNVTPSYLRKIRAQVINKMADKLSDEDATESWVSDAISHKDADKDAVKSVITKRFGKKSAVYDPSDPEANNRLVSKGYKMIHGGSLPSGAWEHVKKHEIVQPSGQISPTSKPYDPNGDKPAKVYSPEEWSDGMKQIHDFTERVVKLALGLKADIRFVAGGLGFSACAGPGGNNTVRLDFNVQRQGRSWFKNVSRQKFMDLLIHELGHYYSDNHLSEDYYDALTDIGSKFVEAAIQHPDEFNLR